MEQWIVKNLVSKVFKTYENTLCTNSKKINNFYKIYKHFDGNIKSSLKSCRTTVYGILFGGRIFTSTESNAIKRFNGFWFSVTTYTTQHRYVLVLNILIRNNLYWSRPILVIYDIRIEHLAHKCVISENKIRSWDICKLERDFSNITQYTARKNGILLIMRNMSIRCNELVIFCFVLHQVVENFDLSFVSIDWNHKTLTIL